MADKHEGGAEGATPDRIQPSADDFGAGEATGADARFSSGSIGRGEGEI